MHGSSRRGARAGQAQPRPAASLGPAPDKARVQRLLEPVVHAMNMDLEELAVATAGGRRVLRVVVDSDGGVSLDDIALASREFSAKLDDGPEMGDAPWTLEVTSPGVDRPLTLPRHWRRNAGRLVSVTGPDGKTITGRIAAAGESGVTLDTGSATREYRYADLGPGKIQVEFSRPGEENGEEDDSGGH